MKQETLDAVEDGVRKLAERATDMAEQGYQGNALTFAQGAKELAEAHAWLRNPGQPH